ncbi:MAG: hypothetical protein EPN79_16065 [Burkholderiaceae bacterium]|nr:MAG: hypothetical protein EPN79_16065 [Burkholderiaceae bacterium]
MTKLFQADKGRGALSSLLQSCSRIRTALAHQAYLQGHSGKRPARWLRRLAARSLFHRAWQAGWNGYFIQDGIAYGTCNPYGQGSRPRERKGPGSDDRPRSLAAAAACWLVSAYVGVAAFAHAAIAASGRTDAWLGFGWVQRVVVSCGHQLWSEASAQQSVLGGTPYVLVVVWLWACIGSALCWPMLVGGSFFLDRVHSLSGSLNKGRKQAGQRSVLKGL